MEICITYIKRAGIYRYCNGYVDRPINEEEASKIIGYWILHCKMKVGFAENDDIKVWCPERGNPFLLYLDV